MVVAHVDWGVVVVHAAGVVWSRFTVGRLGVAAVHGTMRVKGLL